MAFGVFHGWEHETIEAKARWFQSLSVEERMEVFCEFTELALALNPGIAAKKEDWATQRVNQPGVRILRLKDVGKTKQ